MFKYIRYKSLTLIDFIFLYYEFVSDVYHKKLDTGECPKNPASIKVNKTQITIEHSNRRKNGNISYRQLTIFNRSSIIIEHRKSERLLRCRDSYCTALDPIWSGPTK